MVQYYMFSNSAGKQPWFRKIIIGVMKPTYVLEAKFENMHKIILCKTHLVLSQYWFSPQHKALCRFLNGDQWHCNRYWKLVAKVNGPMALQKAAVPPPDISQVSAGTGQQIQGPGTSVHACASAWNPSID